MKEHKNRYCRKTFQSEWNAFLKEGDLSALSVIYEDNFDLLLNYGRKFCRDEAIVEDSIQNIFTNLIRSRERLGNITSVKNYLLVAQRNELFELINKNRNTIICQELPDNLFKPEYSIEEEIIEAESHTRLKKLLNDCLLKLTSHQQEILYLKYDVGLSYEDISKILNISVESCRTAIYRSVKIIKANIESLGIRNIHIFFSILRPIDK